MDSHARATFEMWWESDDERMDVLNVCDEHLVDRIRRHRNKVIWSVVRIPRSMASGCEAKRASATKDSGGGPISLRSHPRSSEWDHGVPPPELPRSESNSAHEEGA